MYFSRGNLPWQERYLGGGKGGTKEDKYRRILDKKDCPSTCGFCRYTKPTYNRLRKAHYFCFHLTMAIGYNSFAKSPTLIALNATSKEETY